MSQVIDVAKYVDYVFYYTENAKAHLGDATEFFTRQMNQSLSEASSRAKKKFVEVTAESQKLGKGAAEALEKTDLTKLYQSIADALNDGMNQSTVNKAASIFYQGSNGQASYLDQAASYRNLLTKNPDAERVENFLNLVKQALSLVTELDASSDEAFSALSAILMGESKTPFVFNSSDYKNELIAKTIQYLGNAANAFQKGPVSAESFQGTLSNIFNTVIGEKLSQILVLQALEKGNDKILQCFKEQGKILNRGNGKWEVLETGTGKSGGTTAKVDLLSNGLLQLTINLNGQSSATIQLMTNFSVKFSKSRPRKNSITILNSGVLGTFISQMDKTEQAYVYNSFAHIYDPHHLPGAAQASFKSSLPSLRKFIAASFFDSWLAGSGGALQKAGQTVGQDLNQFVFYNGKIYSVLSIVENVVNKWKKNNNGEYGLSGPVSADIKIPKIENQWQGSGADLAEAQARSEAIKAVINTFKINGHLNINVFDNL